MIRNLEPLHEYISAFKGIKEIIWIIIKGSLLN